MIRVAGRTVSENGQFALIRAIAVISLLFLLSPQCLFAQSSSPNVVLILADDLGYGDVGAYGATDIFTPNIDQLANEGVLLERFYTAPSCSISRSMLLTGSYAPRNSLGRNHTPSASTGIHADEITLGDLLQSVGYATGLFGKWHLGDHYQYRPQRHGFASFYGIPYSNNMWPFHPRTAPAPGEDPRLTAARQRAEQTGYAGSNQAFPLGEGYPNLPVYDGDTIIGFNPDQETFGAAFVDAALSFIEANAGGPFFAFIPLTAPHVPLHPAEEFVGTSPRGLYGDTVQEIDAGVGRVLNKLVELGIDSDTLVIFLSDNGPWLEYGIDGGSAGALAGGKEGQFEGGIRVPGLMRWPSQLNAGRVIAEPVSAVDIFPTLARVTGAVLPSGRVIDGIDVWDLLAGTGSGVSRTEFFGFDEADFTDVELGAVIGDRWKLHVRTSGGSVSAQALYDLVADPGETADVKGSQGAVVSSLLAKGNAVIADIEAGQRPLGQVVRNGEPFAEFPGVGDLISIEAENYHAKEARSGHDWTSVSLRHSSFESSLQASPNSGSNLNGNYASNSPHLAYRFIADHAARYYVWVRGRGASGDDDSLHIGFNGQPVASGNQVTDFESFWSWSSRRRDGGRAFVDIPAPGQHTLDAWMREDGTIIDKFLLTTDPNFVPRGKGLVESRQSTASLNVPPIAVDDGPYTVAEGGSIQGDINVLVNDIDPRADPRTAILISPPASASDFELRPDGSVLYQHDGSETSQDSFVYVAEDVDGVSNEAIVSITVLNANDAPVISLLGANPINLSVGQQFVDPGAIADDEEDGDISGDIVVGGDAVNTAVAGTYVLTYDVADSAGEPALQKSRTVIVNVSVPPPPPPPPPVSSGGGGSNTLPELLLLGWLVLYLRVRRRNQSGNRFSSAGCHRDGRIPRDV